MFGKGIKLFKLFGYEVRIDFSWVFIAILVTWSLAAGVFPAYYKGAAEATYWIMGLAGMVGLFISIVIHEFAHSLVARQQGVPMQGITLFIFGGMAEMKEEPKSGKSELYIALVGPITSIVIGVALYAAYLLMRIYQWPMSVAVITGYLGLLNLILAAFNLLPAFPLDGGRVFRAIVWQIKGDLHQATRIASRVGGWFGLLIILLGVFSFFSGNFIAGMWWVLIGFFIRSAASSSYRQLLIRETLEHETIERFINRNPVVVQTSLPLDQLVQDFAYRYHYKMFPVADDGKLEGCVDVRAVKDIAPQEWGQHTVGEISEPCNDKNTITPQTGAMQALAIMRRSGRSRLLVADQGRIVGIIAIKDMLEYLTLRLDLEKHERLA